MSDVSPRPAPSPARIVLAFLFAPLLPSVILAWQLANENSTGDVPGNLKLVLIVAYAIDLLLGVPLFVLLSRSARRRLWVLCLANAAITAGGAFAAANTIAFLDGGVGGLQRPDLHELLGFGDLALLGAFGGAIFWGVSTLGGARTASGRSSS